MNLSENALHVLEARYLRRDGEGRLCETPEQLFARVRAPSRTPNCCWAIVSNRRAGKSASTSSCPAWTSCRTLPPS